MMPSVSSLAAHQRLSLWELKMTPWASNSLCHDANFVVTGSAPDIVIITTYGATSDYKIGIMTTLICQRIGMANAAKH